MLRHNCTFEGRNLPDIYVIHYPAFLINAGRIQGMGSIEKTDFYYHPYQWKQHRNLFARMQVRNF